MTPDDEAFVRTIVDRPGDDLPRLVYADWLDERNDERGAYLRTEFELVKNDDIGGLRALRMSLVTTALDPVWAMCVSRPPSGVCCDHIRFNEAGRRTTRAMVLRFAEKHDLRLPDDYLAFLVNYNGGSPDPNRYKNCVVDRFYPLGRSPTRASFSDLKSVYLQYMTDYLGGVYFAENNPWHWHYPPIGVLHEGGDQLCLGVHTTNAGQVYSLVHNRDYDPRHVTYVAQSLSAFLFESSYARSPRYRDY